MAKKKRSAKPTSQTKSQTAGRLMGAAESVSSDNDDDGRSSSTNGDSDRSGSGDHDDDRSHS